MSAVEVPTLECPSWCMSHPYDEPGAPPVHVRVVEVGEVYVEIEWVRGEVDPEGQPQGPKISLDHYRWVSGDTARDFARAILDAVDLAEHGTTLKQSIGASVNAAMTERGLTVAELGRRAEISEGKLWRRLQGAASFTAEDIVRIARALDVEVGVLLT